MLRKIAEKREKEELLKAIEAESKLIQRYKKSWINSVVIALLTVYQDLSAKAIRRSF